MSEDLRNVVEIVAAYVSHNSVPAAELPALIQTVSMTLGRLGESEAPRAQPLVPAVPIKKSVTDEYLICLEDGQKLKSLKRHIGKLGFTPVEYRQRWGLPADYPMTAPNYSKARSALAKQLGLGRIGGNVTPITALVG